MWGRGIRAALAGAVAAVSVLALTTGAEPARAQLPPLPLPPLPGLPTPPPDEEPPAEDSLLRPDLITRPFPELRVCKASTPSCPGQQGQTYLRLANLIANRGAGPLEIFPETGTPEEGTSRCDETAPDDRYAYQRVFKDWDGNGIFERDVDTEWVRHGAGCMTYHEAHNHWHFDAFSRYELRREWTGKLVATSNKTSFCVIDTDHVYRSLAGSPTSGYYPQAEGCTADATEGLSVGWGDTYGAALAGQELRVTGQPRGDYCLISTADPLNRLQESSDSNNVWRQRIRLDPAKPTVTKLSGSCRFLL